MNDIPRHLVVLLLIVTGLCATQTAAAVQVDYTPEQVGTVSAPVVGLGSTDSDYLVTKGAGTSTLDKDFDGNNQEIPGFVNPVAAQDAASFYDDYMLQLGTDNNITKIDISDGSLEMINGNIDIYTGAHTFGIGYDASVNQIGIGKYNDGQMTFQIYDLETDSISELASFAFDTSQYGTPTGLDFVKYKGSLRMLVGTRDGPGENWWDSERNYILDMDAATGSVDQYATNNGSSNKLQDLLYHDGRLATVYKRSGTGFVRAGNYTPVPEPATIALLGTGSPGVLRFRASNNTDHPAHENQSIDEIRIKTDGLRDVYCSDANHPDWQADRFTPDDEVDLDNDGTYDRGVFLFSDVNNLKPGEHIDFELDSVYADNLDSSTAAFYAETTGETITSLCRMPVCNLPSDIDKDGFVDSADLWQLSAAWLDAAVNPRADINDDGDVNFEDFAELAAGWHR